MAQFVPIERFGCMNKLRSGPLRWGALLLCAALADCTPHNGATTPATARRSVEIFIDNLQRFVAGQPLRNIVDKSAGY